MKILQSVLDAIIHHAKEGAPLEICGYLAGPKKGLFITKAIPLTNTDKSSEHYTLDPKEQFDTVKSLRKEEMLVRAVYHSHPESPARMSEEDIRLALDPNVLYVIVSLNATEPVVKAFHCVNGLVTEEPLDLF